MAHRCGTVWTFVSLTTMLSLGHVAIATQFTVGGSSGWNTGVDYSTWAAGNSFTVGDSLEFPYSAGTHSVLEVSQSDYSSCNTGNAISSSTSGNTLVKLTKAQTYYFICGVAGHCQQGMQLSVSVSAAATPSANTTSPSSTSPSTPSSTPSTATPSSNSSSASSSARIKVNETLLLLAAAIALLCLREAL